MGSVINAIISLLVILVVIRSQRDGNIAKRLQPCSRRPLGIHKQKHNPANERECSDDWRNEVTLCGFNVHSKEVDRLSWRREGEARVSEHYDA
jgi:hypothetical protein